MQHAMLLASQGSMEDGAHPATIAAATVAYAIVADVSEQELLRRARGAAANTVALSRTSRAEVPRLE